MNRTEQIEKRLAELLNANFGIPFEEMASDVPFEDFEVDSLVLVEFSLTIKKEWGVLLVDGELLPDHTLAQTAALIAAKAGAEAVEV